MPESNRGSSPPQKNGQKSSKSPGSQAGSFPPPVAADESNQSCFGTSDGMSARPLSTTWTGLTTSASSHSGGLTNNTPLSKEKTGTDSHSVEQSVPNSGQTAQEELHTVDPPSLGLAAWISHVIKSHEYAGKKVEEGVDVHLFRTFGPGYQPIGNRHGVDIIYFNPETTECVHIIVRIKMNSFSPRLDGEVEHDHCVKVYSARDCGSGWDQRDLSHASNRTEYSQYSYAFATELVRKLMDRLCSNLSRERPFKWVSDRLLWKTLEHTCDLTALDYRAIRESLLLNMRFVSAYDAAVSEFISETIKAAKKKQAQSEQRGCRPHHD
ncbi:hypothetical protein QFC22_006474 [Naganishia vaughanmartiniae]|uniref:Uncharacterized protein n=1 Tax=Naganishia vaughanmartiniae TaxID=1424756 RepID=A0ACC2WJM8_9TREE|nr:hypothetical protein QFC22_006474 [Naganishia vaughanmartiniae]